jgi:hypothetical protein
MPGRTVMVINETAARTQGITIPPELRKQAEVILP